jgi:hypothetical protein
LPPFGPPFLGFTTIPFSLLSGFRSFQKTGYDPIVFLGKIRIYNQSLPFFLFLILTATHTIIANPKIPKTGIQLSIYYRLLPRVAYDLYDFAL